MFDGAILKMNEITAVLFTYMRPHLLQDQIEALKKQTYPPEKIIIGHLETEEYTPQFNFENLRYVTFHEDPGVRAKWLTALCAKTDYVAVIDDDIIPGKRWFEHCIELSMEKRAVYGALGFYITDDYYEKLVPYRDYNEKPEEVDFLGQSWFLPREFAHYPYRELMPYDVHSEDDIWFGYQLWKRDIPQIVPRHPRSNPELWGAKEMRSRGKVALNKRRDDHKKNRKKLIKFCKEHGWGSDE